MIFSSLPSRLVMKDLFMEGERETSSMTCLTPKDSVQSPNMLVRQPKKETTTQTPKTTRGRQKIEIKKIEEETKRQVTFSKRRRGLFKKSAELSVLTGAKIAVITFSKCDRIYRFGHVDALIDKYLRKSPVKLEGYSGDNAADEESRRPWWERPVESVPEEELEEYMAALSMLRENIGKKIVAMGNDRTVDMVPAWPINVMGWKPTMDMQKLENLTDGVNRCRVGQNGD
ncbi:MADS-box transcription factor family protein [Arabidopsis thaliana]|uniref:MADS-box transcription factor family protein n=2 Tax=Arabidopsis thaliana TaxID=3702 RepID=A0A1P8AT79_ARATH|nr:MADS-box transcription factor family protein [Arabidopsis thaliana]ANM59863.1 MADS-box transcription factor family protein [Arabidopsis thaliana]|eukprot:NP_001322190.1 MADS-box transcription factor family protein [Arabidopsis thaliana]